MAAQPKIKPEQVTIGADSGWRHLPAVGVGLALLGGGICGALAGGNLKQFYHSYLVAFLFFLSLALGGLFFVLVQFATRSGWSVVVRRIAENVMGTLPLFALLFVPVALGAHDLFHWTHAEAVAGDELLQAKQPYLNEGFFYGRAAVYLLIWSALSWYLRRQSVRQDATGDHDVTRKLQAFCAPMLLVYALSLTFAAFDWLMSLDPHWYSTIFGVYFFAGSVVGIYSVMILLVAALRRSGLMGQAVTADHFHDMGKMLLAFVAFWAYIAFSQYFLIWYANIPEETIWFLHRWKGSWKLLSVFMGVGHFALPFFFLLPRTIKRHTGALVAAAVWMLAAHYIDLYWLVMPGLHHHGVQPHLLDLGALLLVGGLFLGTVGLLMRRGALVPVADPRLPESLSFENV